MDRRAFIAAGVAGAAGANGYSPGTVSSGIDGHLLSLDKDSGQPGIRGFQEVRNAFPRLESDVFLNAAGGTPLSRFTEAGLRRYEEYWRYGPDEGRSDYVGEMLSEIRQLFAVMVGADAEEIGLVHCTKAGEQIVLDGLPALRAGGNVVTNDLHFSGSLHNLEGLRRAGLDVRVVRTEDWRVDLDRMVSVLDDRTALVSVSLVSNVNGHVEPIRELADAAHGVGAFLYADIIQAAGIVPIDLHAMGVDFAACNGYKWLYGPHGAGFFFVRRDLQGGALSDRLFPGNARHNYAPWVDDVDAARGPFIMVPRSDASRYEPGHVSYLGYCGLYEGLKFVQSIGVEECRAHSVRLNRRLRERLDADRYRDISTHPDASPIATFVGPGGERLETPLRAARLVVALSGDRIRVSPAVYNTGADIDLLADVLNDVV